MLKLEKVSIGYGTQPDILHGVSLDVHSAEMFALIGKNGTGKTTLIRVLTGLLPLRSGRISYDGSDLAVMDPRERARLISVVPQSASLPPGYTVYETIAHGRTPYLNWYGKLSEADRSIIDWAIHITGLDDYVCKDVSKLSGGEQQRVILARALVQKAPVMILDEPTSSLDIYYQVALLNLVREICREQGIAVVFIIHDLNLAARFADRIAILHNREIASVGAPRDVLKEEIISSVFDINLRFLDDPEEGLVILPRINSDSKCS